MNTVRKSDVTNKVYIIILNWNGWKDTIECLESVFRSDYTDYQVIVCDNGSTDGSVGYFQMWAEGRLDCAVSTENPMLLFTSPPVPKPVLFAIYDRVEVEVGSKMTNCMPLTIISNGVNLGFAGGNNVGLRYILAKDDFAFVWLLNNDTVVTPSALSALVRRMEERPEAGLCGSTLLYYDLPENVQALGGFTYNTWFALSRPIGYDKKLHFPLKALAVKRIENRMFGVQGAAVFVSRAFLLDVGLMGEDYFLYFEEQDWAARARGLFTLAYAPDSIVYHKEGASTAGQSRSPRTKSALSDYYGIRSRILFTRNYFPWALPTVYLGLVGTLFNRILRRQWGRLGMILRLAIAPNRRFNGAAHTLQDR